MFKKIHHDKEVPMKAFHINSCHVLDRVRAVISAIVSVPGEDPPIVLPDSTMSELGIGEYSIGNVGFLDLIRGLKSEFEIELVADALPRTPGEVANLTSRGITDILLPLLSVDANIA